MESLRIIPLIVTSSSRLGPRAGARSISREDSELSEEIEVPEGERGIEVSAAVIDSDGEVKLLRCSSRSLKSSDRSFCQAIPSERQHGGMSDT